MDEELGRPDAFGCLLIVTLVLIGFIGGYAVCAWGWWW